MSNFASWASWASASAANESPPEPEAPRDLIDLKQVALFDAIDQLGRLSLVNDIAYPQLVVVGDQSHGKSSVLEAIGRFHFPVSEEVCTRFPTKLVLRRSMQEHERVFIEPGSSRTARDRDMLQKFGGPVTGSAPLSEWMRKAAIVLGVSRSRDSDISPLAAGDGQRQFTDDVLVIEKYGPDLPLVNLVDLPGLFQAPDEDNQDEASQRTVFDMVQDYIRSPQNFILLVISARNSVYNHTGLRLVQEIAREDPGLVDRVVGVITNPDHAQSLRETLSLLRGHHSSKVGRCKWHVVKNQDPVQRLSRETLVQRDRNEEQFFLSNENWKVVPDNQKGISGLNATLRDAFREHTRIALPSLISKIQAKLTAIDHRLREVDSSRATHSSRQQLLVKIASKFARLTDRACSGYYENPVCNESHEVNKTCRDCEPFFLTSMSRGSKTNEGHDGEDSGHHAKLRANLRALNRTFSSAMVFYGKTKDLNPSHQKQPTSDEHSPNLAAPGVTHPSGATISKYYMHEKPELILPDEFESWVAGDLMPRWSAREPTGEPSEAAYHALFMGQTEKWHLISGKHLEAVWEATEHFVELALTAACPYPDLRGALQKHLIRPRIEHLRSKSNRTLNDLLHCHVHGGTGFYDAVVGARAANEHRATVSKTGGASNDSKTENASESQNSTFDVLAGQISDAVFTYFEAQASVVHPTILVPIRQLVSQVLNNAASPKPETPAQAPQQTAAGRVIQHVEENYHTSLVSFVGYVNALVVESGILRELPRGVFTPDIVMAETADVIDDIAGEKETDVKRRERDERDLEELRAVLEVLEDHVGKRRH